MCAVLMMVKPRVVWVAPHLPPCHGWRSSALKTSQPQGLKWTEEKEESAGFPLPGEPPAQPSCPWGVADVPPWGGGGVGSVFSWRSQSSLVQRP